MIERFDYIIKILETSESALAGECLSKIRAEEIRFQPGFFKEKKELESLYELRLRMVAELNKDKFKAEELDLWKKAINELKTINFDQVLLSSISTDDKLYMIFVNADANILGAIFFLYQKQSLEDLDKSDQEIKERGYSSSTLKLIKGKLVDSGSNVA